MGRWEVTNSEQTGFYASRFSFSLCRPADRIEKNWGTKAWIEPKSQAD
jgi:hypothetical protein